MPNRILMTLTICFFSYYFSSNTTASAKSAKRKQPVRSAEFKKYRAEALNSIAGLINGGLKQHKVQNIPTFGANSKSFMTRLGKAHHSRNAIRHTATLTVQSLTITAFQDWQTKRNQGLHDARIIFWTDRSRRQHAAAISIEWWIGEEAQYKESYTRLNLDQLWIEEKAGIFRSLPTKNLSRELTLMQPKIESQTSSSKPGSQHTPKPKAKKKAAAPAKSTKP